MVLAKSSDTQAISLNINDLNDPPVISSGSSGSIAENASIGTINYDTQPLTLILDNH